MSLHQLQSQNQSDDPLRAQRMTADEAASVIARWQQERVQQTGLTDRPAVPDVAEGLDVPIEEVQRLLAAVRAQRLEEERALAQEQELAEAQMRLAEEEAMLADIQQQRTELECSAAEVMWQVPVHQVRPANVPHRRLGKPTRVVEWTGAEDFWQETEEDKKARTIFRATKGRRTVTYALYTIFLLFPFGLILWLLYLFLMALVS